MKPEQEPQEELDEMGNPIEQDVDRDDHPSPQDVYGPAQLGMK